MELRVLAVGDVVGDGGLQCLEKHLRSLKKLYRADFCVVNGENASGTGLTPRQADRMLDAGADVITLGNHSFDRREICTYLDDCPYILRPGNLRPSLPGRGWGVFETKIGPVGVMNLLGRCNLDFRPDNPFLIADKILQELQSTRERGFAIDNCEHELNVRCVGVPVYNARGALVAGISSSGAVQVMTDRKVMECADILMGITQRIKERLYA